MAQRPNNSVPLNVSWQYVLWPGGPSQQRVEIISIDGNLVRVRGVDQTTAEWTVRLEHFDDLVAEWYEGGYGILTEDGGFFLATEDLAGALGA